MAGKQEKVKKITKINPVKPQVMMQLQPKKRVCAYCRVSTDSREQQNSFTAQTAYYEEMISSRSDWQYVGIYADEARSGTKLQRRDDFLRMMKDCEAGKIDMIITKSITRFARNTVDSIKAIRKLKLLGIAVFFEKENINTLSESSEMLLTILSSLAQGESESTSTNNKWAAVKRFQEGTFIVSTPAHGYTNVEGELVIDEQEAETVRFIFKEYLNGKGSYVIARKLTEKGIQTVRGAEKWSDGVVKEILQNPVYTGNLILQKTYSAEVVPFKRKKNKGELPQYFISENHEPIISMEEAEAVKEIYEYRRKQMKFDGTKSQNRYAYSSKIICGECGGVFRRQKIYIGKPYEKVQWCCIQHIEHKEKCSMTAIREDIIQDAFILMWNKLSSNYTEMLSPMLESLKRLRADEQQEKEIRECNEKIMELSKQSHILSGVVAKGYLDSAIFIEKQTALQIELDAMRKKRKALLDESGFESEIFYTEQLIGLLESHPGIQDTYREDLFLQSVEQIIIKEGKTVTFRLKNKLELSEHCGKEDCDDAKTYADGISDAKRKNIS
ncbi:recombinase family protein [Clostridium sp. FS41]|uniref:recombinase family protein n=1 Tax=Clostridia TaxID=186801 RepID=UPI0005D3ED75|nr:recombinase family protein [Clostridium sp. FS41]KJJ68608.1 transposon Tn3 resolvase [Clostridium sp. FS41]